MFTGIVEEVGKVEAADSNRLAIAAFQVMDDLKVSDSICVNGVCLTVTARDTELTAAMAPVPSEIQARKI